MLELLNNIKQTLENGKFTLRAYGGMCIRHTSKSPDGYGDSLADIEDAITNIDKLINSIQSNELVSMVDSLADGAEGYNSERAEELKRINSESELAEREQELADDLESINEYRQTLIAAINSQGQPDGVPVISLTLDHVPEEHRDDIDLEWLADQVRDCEPMWTRFHMAISDALDED